MIDLKNNGFGLDISDRSLKIAKLKREGSFFKKELSLASFGERPVKKGIIEKNEIKDKQAFIKTLKRALEKVKGDPLDSKYVVVSLPEEKAFMEVIQMPKMEKEEAREAVKYEVENYIPVPLEEVYFDSQVIPPLYNHLDHLDVLIAAFPKKVADPYVSCLKKVGLVPQALEIESQAISRALVKGQVSEEPLLLVDLGATRTSFIIFSGYSLRFTSSIPVSSSGFTEAIAKNLKVSFEKAEQLKIKYGLENKKEIFEALVPALTDLVEQIKTYLDYYRTHTSHEHLPSDGKRIGKILLSGGGSNLKGLSNFLSSQLKVPVSLGNPWINILPSPLKEIPELPFKESLKYTTALGLALRAIKHD